MVDVSVTARNDMMSKKSSGGMRGEGVTRDVLFVETRCWKVDDTGLGRGSIGERSGNAGDCGDFQECISVVGEVIIDNEGDCRCNPGTVVINVIAIVEIEKLDSEVCRLARRLMGDQKVSVRKYCCGPAKQPNPSEKLIWGKMQGTITETETKKHVYTTLSCKTQHPSQKTFPYWFASRSCLIAVQASRG